MLTLILFVTACSKESGNMPLELIEEPNQVKLIDIRISEVSPTNSNGESWDENSPPDIFVEFYYQSGNIEYTDTLHDVSLSSSNNVFTDRSLILDNPQDRIFYTVFEYDEFPIPGLADQVVESGQLRFYTPWFSSIPETLVRGENLKIEWVVEYVY